MAQDTILSAHNLSIGYMARKSTVTIAQHININLKSGSLTALIGANGIGKSTLLRTLTGLQKPLGGQVILNGKDINSYSPEHLSQQLSLVLTDSLPPSNLNVYELVALGRQPYTDWLGSLLPEDITKVNDALKLTQTDELATKKHHELSDGQLQKVLIARALAQDTSLIVLDEPTTHLDLLHKVNLLRLLKKLAQESGKCILYSTHDLDMALQLNDEIIIMKNGNLLQGTSKELIDNKAFDTLFDDADIVFDAPTKTFRVK